MIQHDARGSKYGIRGRQGKRNNPKKKGTIGEIDTTFPKMVRVFIEKNMK